MCLQKVIIKAYRTICDKCARKDKDANLCTKCAKPVENGEYVEYELPQDI